MPLERPQRRRRSERPSACRRGLVQAGLFRALAALKTLQAKAAATAAVPILPLPVDSTKRTQNPL